MTKDQIKTEINKVLDNVPEDVLQDVLSYLRQIQGKSTTQVKMSRDLKKILSEDKKLLQKLAQ